MGQVSRSFGAYRPYFKLCSLSDLEVRAPISSQTGRLGGYRGAGLLAEDLAVFGQGCDYKFSVGGAFDLRGVETYFLPPPPETLALFGPVCKPILINDGADLLGRSGGEGIEREERQHRGRAG